jgi:hypothetical protein
MSAKPEIETLRDIRQGWLLMNNLFTDYPPVPWKKGWGIASGCAGSPDWTTDAQPGLLHAVHAGCSLQLIEPASPCTTVFFSNGLSVRARKRPDRNRIDLLATASGILTGRAVGLPLPALTAEGDLNDDGRISWMQQGSQTVVFLREGSRFALVAGCFALERAIDLAEASLAEDFEEQTRQETEERQPVARLFSINPEHNPPVALAAENLAGRLRERTAAIHGIWSAGGGFETETFSLNELYPLVRAWTLLDAEVALDLVRTALSLQQESGGFPARIDRDGQISAAAPWPLIIQSFEIAWRKDADPALLKKHLPALRKYIQWALRHFDPHRDGIPAWQSEQEIFVPGIYERGQATPELTVFLLMEIEALLRLCEESEHSTAATGTLKQERDRLVQTLNGIFWDPARTAFTRAWKDGHDLHAPSFGSFLPLFWPGLDKDRQTALIEAFDETRGFPGQGGADDWKQDRVSDTRLPAIHQFMALEAFRQNESFRPQRLIFIRRLRESFTAWFEHESLEAVRGGGASAYELGPVTAALILATQAEFEHNASQAPTAAQQILRWLHRRRFNQTDLRILVGSLIGIVIIHLAYNIPRRQDAGPRMAEAALAYQQGRYTEAITICRRFPDHALSQFLQANLLMLAGYPDQAEELYHSALLQETESPSALFGYALALQMNGRHEDAVRRYVDFLDIHEVRQPAAAALADEFRLLAAEGFSTPPRWRRIYALPLMGGLGL